MLLHNETERFHCCTRAPNKDTFELCLPVRKYKEGYESDLKFVIIVVYIVMSRDIDE